MSDLHGVPGLHKYLGEVQEFERFSDGLSPAARLVAGEQTPSPGSEVGQHGSLLVVFEPKSNEPA